MDSFVLLLRRGFIVLILAAFGAPALVRAGDSCSVPLALFQLSPAHSGPLEVAVHWGKIKTEARANIEQRPDRIIVLLDNTFYVNDELWKLEVLLAVKLFEQANPEVPMGLYLISDEPEAFELSTSREAIQNRLKELRVSRPSHKKKRRIYDALISSAALFRNPQFGDALLYMGGGVDHQSSARIEEVRKELLDRGVRIFGVLFKGLYFGPAPISSVPSDISAVTVIDLARSTGGLFEYEGTENNQREFKTSPEISNSAWLKLSASYRRAALVFRLDLSSYKEVGASDLRLELRTPAPSVDKESSLLYPRGKWHCAP